MAREAVEKFPERLIPYAFVDPSYERGNLKVIKGAIQRFGFRGLKVHFGYRVPSYKELVPFIELAREHSAPCLIDCVGRGEIVEKLARDFPEAKTIVAHFGKYLCEDEAVLDRFIGIAEAFGNIYLDSSGVIVTRKIREAVHRVGCHRVIFGTDGPHEAPDTVTFALNELRKIRGLGLRPEEEAAVLGEAIAKLLGIGKGLTCEQDEQNSER